MTGAVDAAIGRRPLLAGRWPSLTDVGAQSEIVGAGAAIESRYSPVVAS